MERPDTCNDVVDLGDATELTRGMSPVGRDDIDGTLKQFAGISDDD